MHPLPACNPLDVCQCNDRYAMATALYQRQLGTLPQRGCPLKAIWFQPSVSLYSPDTRGPTITKPNPRTGPTTPHSSRSNPRPQCTDPVAIRFTTSKRLPPKSYPETAQSPTPDLSPVSIQTQRT